MAIFPTVIRHNLSLQQLHHSLLQCIWKRKWKTKNTQDKDKCLAIFPSVIRYHLSLTLSSNNCIPASFSIAVHPKEKAKHQRQKQTAWSVDIFHKRHPLHLSFAGYHFFANVQQAKNKNTGHTNAKKTQKQHKKNTFQTKINKNHLMPYEPCWPPICSPTTALFPIMVQ